MRKKLRHRFQEQTEVDRTWPTVAGNLKPADNRRINTQNGAYQAADGVMLSDIRLAVLSAMR